MLLTSFTLCNVEFHLPTLRFAFIEINEFRAAFIKVYA